MPAHAGARSVEFGYRATGSAHEAVIHIVRVRVVSRDSARRVDADGEGSLSVARACARSVEVGYGAIGSAHEAVSHIAGNTVYSRDSPRRVDAGGEGSLIWARACARSVEGGEGDSLRPGWRRHGEKQAEAKNSNSGKHSRCEARHQAGHRWEGDLQTAATMPYGRSGLGEPARIYGFVRGDAEEVTESAPDAAQDTSLHSASSKRQVKDRPEYPIWGPERRQSGVILARSHTLVLAMGNCALVPLGKQAISSPSFLRGRTAWCWCPRKSRAGSGARLPWSPRSAAPYCRVAR